MQGNETQEIFNIFNRIFKTKKWLVALSVVTVMIPIAIYNEITAPVYEASTMLVFENFNNPVDNYDTDITKEVFFNNQIEEIRSFSFNEDILNELPEEIVSKIPISEERMAKPGFNRIEYLVSRFQKRISAFPVRGSNIVRINFQASDPEVCRVVANTAADVLKARNMANKQEGIGGVKSHIEGQLAQYKMRLNESEEALRDFKGRNQITSVDREAEELMRRLTEAEVNYNSVKSERSSAQNTLGSLEKKLAENKADLVPSITDVGSSSAQKLRERLISLNLQFMDLEQKGYSKTHPKMAQLSNDMERIKKELTDKALEIVRGDNALNPLLKLEDDLNKTISLQIEIEAMKAREQELLSVINNYNRQLGTLPDKEFTLARLQRDVQVNRDIYLMLQQKLEEAKISGAKQTENIRVIDTAQTPKDPISPRKRLNLAIGMLLGVLMGVAIAFMFEIRNSTLDTPETIEQVTHWPVIGTVPNINNFSKGKFKNNVAKDDDNERIYRALISSIEPNTVIAESYRMLRSNLQFLGVGKQYKTLLATSLGPGDGKTTTLTNLAVAFAAFGHKTLLVDSDLRIPQIHNFFNTHREKGVTDLLGALNDLDEVIANPSGGGGYQNGSASTFDDLKAKEMPSQVTKLAALQTLFREANRDTGIKNLSFMPSGTKLEYPKEFVSTGPMPIILQKFQNKHNIILIDSAPLLLVDDTLMLASIVDAVVLVVHPNKYDVEMLLKAKKMLENANANVVGVVFNNLEVQGHYKKYYSEYAEKV